MKKIIGIAVLLVVFALPVYAQDYCIDFYPVSLSGTEIDDGYTSTKITRSNWEVVVCGYYLGKTSDYFYADLYKGSSVQGEGAFFIEIYGHIIWSSSGKSGYIQGATAFVDDNDNEHTFYIDGTIKKSGSNYSLSMKGGDTFSRDGTPWIVSFSSVKASTGAVMDKDVKKDKGPIASNKGKNIWKDAE